MGIVEVWELRGRLSAHSDANGLSMGTERAVQPHSVFYVADQAASSFNHPAPAASD
jgi:hypothetical protein